MVATSKFKKAQSSLLKLRPYNEKLTKLLNNTISRSTFIQHPLLRKGYGDKQLLIVVGADRGLCGSFNNTILKHVNELNTSKSDIIAVGTKITRMLLKNKQLNIIKEYHSFFENLNIEKTAEFTKNVKNYFLSNQYHSVNIIYIHFKNALSQDISELEMLPISDFKNTQQNTTNQEKIYYTDFIYEPNKSAVLNELFENYLTGTLFRIFNESFTSEQGARMTAMDSATQNAEQMSADLATLYNRARQAAITTELIELSAGVEAQNR